MYMFICLMQLFALFLGKLIFYCFGDCKLRSSCDYKNSNISLAKTKIKQQKPTTNSNNNSNQH